MTVDTEHREPIKIKEGLLILKDFALAKYSLSLKAKETICLPGYMGSTLRGGFGSSFKRTVCFNQDNPCDDCLLGKRCVYAYVFETSVPKNSDRLRKNKDIPRPFIIEPPLNGKREYRQGETLEFDLILIGRAIDYLPYFIVAFKELGTIGLGRGRGKYSLEDVNCEGKQIYSCREEVLRDGGERIGLSKILDETRGYPGDRLTIDFITPTRLKSDKKCVLTPEFHILARSLLARISSLSYFHCNEELSIDFKGVIERAKGVRMKKDETRWWDWERYSRRQDAKMKLGGLAGRVTYQGNLEEFWPLIALGRYVHVGKGTTFGLGRYEIVV